MTQSGTELAVPEAAIERFRECLPELVVDVQGRPTRQNDGWTWAAVQMIAAPVVAAELRRIAAQSHNFARGIEGYNGGGDEGAEAMAHGVRSVMRALELRASKLDGGAS